MVTGTGVDGAMTYFVSSPAFAEAYYAPLRAMRLPRIEAAKSRVRDWFARQTEAGIVVDLGVRS